MGGRGAKSDTNSTQLSLKQVALFNEIAEIRKTANSIRDLMDGMSGFGEGKAVQHKKQCYCCEEYSLPVKSEYKKCKVCGWIDDPYQNQHPDSLLGKNTITLTEARKRYYAQHKTNENLEDVSI